MLRYQASCNDREAAEAALDQLLLMTATFFDDMEEYRNESYLEKSHSLALLRVTLKAFKINTLKKTYICYGRHFVLWNQPPLSRFGLG